MKIPISLCRSLSVILTAFVLLCLTASLASPREEKIAVNFVDVEIPALIKFVSEITGNNFIFDDRVKGKITIIAPTQLTVDETFALFTSVLGLKGYTTIPTAARTFKIIPASLAKEEGIITPYDITPVNDSYITKLIMTDHISAEETLTFLRPVVSRDGHISAFGPRNLLLVVDSAINIERIMSILKLIDKPSVEDEPAKIHVYFLENADAEELALVLQELMKSLQAAGRTLPKDRKKLSAEPLPILSITPDRATNALIIVAPPAEYENISQVIKTLDRRRKQVFVEAMIVEASVDRLADLGTKWRALARHDGEPVLIGGFGNVNSATVLDIITGLTGFSMGGMGNFLDIPVTTLGVDGTITTQNLTAPGFAALFSLDEFKNVINVLSTPQILTSDNEEAEIHVGENVPFIGQRERDITTTNTVLNSIQRTDVGILLRITPQITEGDYIKLNIFQEISSVEDASEEILTTVGPTTRKRSTKTSVVVRDGHTVVIGGLMQEKEEEATSKTPVLGDIPVLGWLFKFKSMSRNKTNLLVFLSPHIVKDSARLTSITEEKSQEFNRKGKFYAHGELLVRFKDSVSQERALEIISQKEASVIKYFREINTYLLRLRPLQEVEDAVGEFSQLPEVLYAEPNYKAGIEKTPLQDAGGKSDTEQPGITPAIRLP